MLKKLISTLVSLALLVHFPATVVKTQTTQNLSISQKNEITFIENISSDAIKIEEKVIATIQFNYEENDISLLKSMATNDLETNNKLIKKIRQSNKEYYSAKNAELIKKEKIAYDNMQVSSYSPFIFIEFDSYSEYEKEKSSLVEISKKIGSVNVQTVEAYKTENCSATVNTPSSAPMIDMNYAKSMIGVSGSTYTGEGVKIGFIEIEAPDDMANFEDPDITVSIYNPMDVEENYHASKVASIAGGQYGIASKADLYFAIGLKPYSVEWLLDQNVNIINISCGEFCGDDTESDHYGNYYIFDAYFDYLIWSNYVHIVTAAGNNLGTENSLYVSHPGIAQNVITVGSVDCLQRVSYFSGYRVDDDLSQYLLKPTIVAPGEYLYLPNTSIDSDPQEARNQGTGTSYSAPMVTGIIALLIEQFPEISIYPEIVSSAIIAGANRLSTQTDLWDERAGAGLINYPNTQQILSDISYRMYSITESTSTVNWITLKTITVPSEKILRYGFATTVNSNVTVMNNNIVNYIPLVTNYTFAIFDSNGNIVDSFVCTKNVALKEFLNSSSADVTYTIKFKINGDKATNFKEYVSAAFRIVTPVIDEPEDEHN